MRTKRTTDIAVGRRAAQEVDRLFPGKKQALLALGCGKHTVNEWRNGIAPSAYYLIRLAELGADVMWILRGRKGSHDGNTAQ